MACLASHMISALIIVRVQQDYTMTRVKITEGAACSIYYENHCQTAMYTSYGRGTWKLYSRVHLPYTMGQLYPWIQAA